MQFIFFIDTSAHHKQSHRAPDSNLEIHVDLPDNCRKRNGKTQTKLDLENAFRRKLNRNLKDRQVLLHKASLLCQFARSYYYNRLLNDRSLMQAALKLLPSKNSYPTESGTEIKYFTSLTTWYKTIMKLQQSRLYPEYPCKKLKRKFLKEQLQEQIKQKQACCKQDMIFLFVILLRGMGIHCRLIVNLQPLPMKPAASDLLPMMKLKPDNDKGDDNEKEVVEKKKIKLDKSLQEKKVTVQSVDKKSKSTNSEQKNIISKKREMEIVEKIKVVKSDENPLEVKKTRSKAKKIDNISSDDHVINPVEEEKATSSLTKLSPIIIDKNNTKTSSKSSETNLIVPFIGRRTRNANNNKKEPKQTKAPEKEASLLEQPVPESLKKSEKSENCSMKETTIVRRVLRQRNQNTSEKTTLSIPQLDGANDLILDDEKPKRKKRPQLKKLRSKEEQASDDDFQPSPPKKVKAPILKKENRKVLSSDEDEDKDNKKKNTNAVDIWVEAWSDAEEKWICIDIFSGKVYSVEAIRKSASSHMAYVYAFQNDLSVKDVTARYASNWSNVMRKLRVENTWLNTALASYRGHHTKRDVMEDQELRRIHEEKPLPTAISDFKNHPLYVLERHLLKYEAIYPPDAPTLGFVRKEPVYPRDCVHNLHTRDIWLREARVVKLGETPYKIKLRPKWDKTTQKVLKDVPMELFGYWQTMDYEPPTAENGIVPRNEYGNVELFKQCMLPKKCVHLKLPGLLRVCKKLSIDCANAVVGFDFHQGYCHPEYDGFVICEEFKDTVVDAWNQEQEEIERKEREKYETRVYGNWKKLIRGLVIRERIKNKYNI